MFGNFSRDTKEKMVTLILGGFGLVAALAWNDAIQSLFSHFFPTSDGFVGKLIYAALVTLVVVLISQQLAKISDSEK